MVPAKIARADDIRPAMEAANAQFLAAFNTPNPSAFPSLYTKDSVLSFQSAPPITGPEAIKQFWVENKNPHVQSAECALTEALRCKGVRPMT